MSKELELYQAFIDGLVERKDSITARWLKGDGFPRTEDNQTKNEFLAALTQSRKRCWPDCFRRNISRGFIRPSPTSIK